MTELPINGCRHCGQLERDHANLWTEGVGWHQYVEPSDEVRKSRMHLRDTSGSARISAILEQEGMEY